MITVIVYFILKHKNGERPANVAMTQYNVERKKLKY